MLDRRGNKVHIVASDGAEFEGTIIKETSTWVKLRTDKGLDHKLFRVNFKKIEHILLEVPVETPKEEPKKEVDENATNGKTKI